MKGFLDCFLDCNEKRTCYSGFRGGLYHAASRFYSSTLRDPQQTEVFSLI